MSTQNTDAQAALASQLLSTDPEAQRLFTLIHTPTGGPNRYHEHVQHVDDFQAYMRAHNASIPHDYQVKVNPQTGEWAVKRESWFQRNMDWVVPAAIIGGGAAAAFAAPAVAPSLGPQLGGTASGAGTFGAPAGVAYGGGTAATTATTTGGVLSKVGSVYSKVKGSKYLEVAGRALGSASETQANNRGAEDDYNLAADREYQSEFERRAAQERQERVDAQNAVARSSYYANRTPGPNNVRGFTPLSPEYQTTLSEAEKAAIERLKQPTLYGTPQAAPLVKRTPTKPGKLEKWGGYVSPILTAYGDK